jgi:hypothetical protein
MALLDEDASSTRRSPLIWIGLVVVIGLAAAAGRYWLGGGGAEPVPDAPIRRPPETAPARPAPERPPAARERETRPRGPERTPPAATPEPAAPAPTPKPGGVLRVRSDVAGATVFLDRQFVGNTPLELDGIAPGTHRLNVSADGFDGHAQQVEIGDVPAEIEVRFREVTLDAAIAVVHKHGVGSCNGRLIATTSGLRYDTPHAGDAFTLAFAALETFEVDYLKKNLRVKRRGGKTWNFEDPAGNADALFVFHRDVEQARRRLAR